MLHIAPTELGAVIITNTTNITLLWSFYDAKIKVKSTQF
jgi:hypothetical protein